MKNIRSFALPLAMVAAIVAHTPSLAAASFSSSSAHQYQNAANTVPATEQKPNTPYQGTITIVIDSGSNQGSENGVNNPGTQTLLIPAGQRLIIQTVSMFRATGGSSGSTVQVFIDASLNNAYGFYALPPVTNNGAVDIGATFTGTLYADGGTELLANAYRSNTTGTETVTVSVTGYLVKK